ncbi:MAG: thrombospondin type 3 repeat-containing protein [Planctomycetes bacterium]|nr:thrombospondin type 3 repeat-containing protein [Planctomycetota bacterium]
MTTPNRCYLLLLAAVVALLGSILLTSSAQAETEVVSLGEALDNTDLIWTTGGDADWFGQSSVFFSGGDAAQSGSLAAGQNSWLQTTVTGPGILAFACRADEHWLTFSIDGSSVTLSVCDNDDEWTALDAVITSGEHIVRWQFNNYYGEYVAYLDDVAYFPSQPVSLSEALDNAGLAWNTGGDVPWVGVVSSYFSGNDVAQSSGGDVNQESWLETNVSGPGLFSYSCRAVSPATPVARLTLSLDGESDGQLYDCPEGTWQRSTMAIPSGSHTIRLGRKFAFPNVGVFVDGVDFLPAPAIAVQSPSAGDTWYRRQFSTITWLTSGFSDAVDIELYKGGSFVQVIANNADNDGNYPWFVPVTMAVGNDYHIAIASTAASSVSATSDGTFSILAADTDLFGGVLIPDNQINVPITPDNSELDIGDQPAESFTVEAWFTLYGPTSGEIHQQVFQQQDAFELYLVYYYSQSLRMTLGCVGIKEWSAENLYYQVCGYYTANVWHHVALTFDGVSRQAQLYVDGYAYGGPIDIGTTVPASAVPSTVGDQVLGALDELRISDVVRYTGPTFSVPTGPFECDGNTRALWHFDESDPMGIFHDACGVDNALTVAGTTDSDGDGVWDIFDDDDDGDGIADVQDSCPLGAATGIDTDGDGCKADTEDGDDDGDGIADDQDSCPLGTATGIDTDGDGCKDATEDSDDDGDGVADNQDSCPLGAATGIDTDGDGCKDATEDSDDDGDGVADNQDSCPLGAATGIDTDGDGCKDDAEDSDDDGDGIADDQDAFPLDPSESIDTDGDGIGDNADTDDDNDGLTDIEEVALGTNPTLADTDGDGINDKEDPEPLNGPARTEKLYMPNILSESSN